MPTSLPFSLGDLYATSAPLWQKIPSLISYRTALKIHVTSASELCNPTPLSCDSIEPKHIHTQEEPMFRNTVLSLALSSALFVSACTAVPPMADSADEMMDAPAAEMADGEMNEEKMDDTMAEGEMAEEEMTDGEEAEEVNIPPAKAGGLMERLKVV
jgi:hypothetical protein